MWYKVRERLWLFEGIFMHLIGYEHHIAVLDKSKPTGWYKTDKSLDKMARR